MITTADDAIGTNGSARSPYARVVRASKRARWDIDESVIRGRSFDLTHKLMPDGLSLAERVPFLDDDALVVLQPGAGPDLREHVRSHRAIREREDPRGEPPAPARRPRRRWKRWSASATRS